MEWRAGRPSSRLSICEGFGSSCDEKPTSAAKAESLLRRYGST